MASYNEQQKISAPLETVLANSLRRLDTKYWQMQNTGLIPASRPILSTVFIKIDFFDILWRVSVAKAAFLGLGVMGYPMAGHLAAAGHEVVVYNRTAEKAKKWTAQHGGSHASTPAEASRGAEFVFACVGDDADIRAVTTGTDGAFSNMADNAVFIDNTTASADVARELYQAARDKGLNFIDAPVSGGQAGAENGKLTVMCGGDADAFGRAEPLMSCYGQRLPIWAMPGRDS